MGHCENYKGGYINPNNLINLTHKFSSLVKKNLNAVLSFTEQPVAQGDAESQEITQARAELLEKQQNP